jgi:hypothetical protein
MESPFGYIGSIAASGFSLLGGSIPLVRARTLSITIRETCSAQLDADTTVSLFYSPDGNNWDTQLYTSFTLTFSAGNTIQRTVIIDPPEHGYFEVQVTNGSANGTLSKIKGWYSIQAWDTPTKEVQRRGDITTIESET